MRWTELWAGRDRRQAYIYGNKGCDTVACAASPTDGWILNQGKESAVGSTDLGRRSHVFVLPSRRQWYVPLDSQSRCTRPRKSVQSAGTAADESRQASRLPALQWGRLVQFGWACRFRPSIVSHNGSAHRSHVVERVSRDRRTKVSAIVYLWLGQWDPVNRVNNVLYTQAL